MSSENFHKAPGRDVLQMNMENISKELSDLMVTCEQEVVMMQQRNYGTMNHLGIVDPNQRITANMGAVQQDSEVFYQKNEHVSTMISQCKPIVKHNHNLAHPQNYHFTSNAYVAAPSNMQPYPVVYPPTGGSVFQNSTILVNNSGCVPKIELHYLRPQTEAIQLKSPPLLSLHSKDEPLGRPLTGAYRKYNRTQTKYNKKGNPDYNNVLVDIAELGISKDGKEPNLVLRLFALFRNVHRAIVEVPFTMEPPCDSAYEPTFAPLPNVVMPCTMNVQHQVKYASAQVLTFLCSMQRVLVHNVSYDQNLAEECGRTLFKLRHLLAQFEMYKFIDLEHKRGQFISEEVRAHAENLEKLMEQINRQIREVNVRVIAFDWYIGMKYRKESGPQKPLLENIKDNAPKEKTKIGIINEILQLCNTMPTMTTAITKPNQIEPTSLPLMNSDDKLSKRSMNIINNKNHDEFITEPNAAVSLPLPPVKTTSATHIRQPVFYIG